MSEIVAGAVAATKESMAKTQLGFWIYLMTDCVLFATLFATYAVLRGSTFGGPSGHELFNMPLVLVETLALLTSSFTCGLMLFFMGQKAKTQTLVLLAVTFVLGAVFLGIELTEFAHLASEGNSWQRSAFLSSFFTLVGTHGAHITVGLLWAGVLGFWLFKKGFSEGVSRRLLLFGLFWHFLDIIWIFIFSIVYLVGVA